MSELYHVLNRGVDKRKIFLDDRDRARFVHDMWEFNDTVFVDNVRHRLPTPSGKNTDFVSPYMGSKERIVDMHGWCLMDNHYHLLLSERVEGGLTQFIRRLNIGYAKYFNERYERDGTLFQGRTKKVLIERDAHFLHILHYIHLNPLDYLRHAKDWRSLAVRNSRACIEHLEKYRWSSYLDYTGHRNFPSVLTTDLFGEVFHNYKRTVERYIKDIETDVLESYKLE